MPPQHESAFFGNRPKREPSAEMRAAARSVHELYTALTDEGFTSREALTILGHMLSASIAASMKKDTDE